MKQSLNAKGQAQRCMCRCTDGDLWTLAKKYGSDTELIKQINEIEEVLTDDCCSYRWCRHEKRL